jgi:hypothetical protein
LLFLIRINNKGSFYSDSCYLLTYFSTRVLSHPPPLTYEEIPPPPQIYLPVKNRSNFESVSCTPEDGIVGRNTYIELVNSVFL